MPFPNFSLISLMSRKRIPLPFMSLITREETWLRLMSGVREWPLRVRAYYDYTDVTVWLLRGFAEEWQQGLRENKRAEVAVAAV